VDLGVWTDILSTYRELEGLVTRSLSDAAASVDLFTLRSAMRRRFEGLRVSLSASMPAEQAVEVLVPLLFLFDERVLGRLGSMAEGRELSWPTLQRDLFPAEDGGDVFFEKADELCRYKDTPSVLIEVYLFCLQAGFQGRFSDDPTSLSRYEARLGERISVPALPTQPAAEGALPRATPARTYLLVALGAAVLLYVILFAVSLAM